MADAEPIGQLRRALPQLLREHPEVRHELWGLMLEAFPSRQGFLAFLDELRALREESNRRFEALQHEIAQRFEAMDQRFEMLLREMSQRFEAVDQLFETLLRQMNQRFEAVDRRFEGVFAELLEQRLHLSALGARVGRGLEFIVKGIVEEFADDVLKFQRKAVFAEAKLGRPLTRSIIALSMDSRTETLMQRLGIEYQVRASLE